MTNRSISVLIPILVLASLVGCGRKKTIITAPTPLSTNSIETNFGSTESSANQFLGEVAQTRAANLTGCMAAADALQKSFLPPATFPSFNVVVASNSTNPATCTPFNVEQVWVTDDMGTNVAVSSTGFAVGSVAQVLSLKILRAGSFRVSIKLSAVGDPSVTSVVVLPLVVTQLSAPVIQVAPPLMVSQLLEASDNRSTITRTFTNAIPVVLNVAGYVRGAYQGAASNAGVSATVSVDGEVCSSYFSFEAFSSSITFQSSATCTRLLPPGTHTITVFDAAVGYPNMGGYFASMQYYATPVESVLLAHEVVADGTSVQDEVEITVPSVLQVSGYITGNYHQSVAANAGVNASLEIDGEASAPEMCASNFSFEAFSHSITFHSAVSCSKYLLPGKYKLKIADRYAGRAPMTLYKSRMQFMVIPAGRVIARNELASTSTHALTESISLAQPGVIDISGWVSGNYYSPTTTSNAGVMITIAVDDVPCTRSFSFEAFSSGITFDSSARCIKRLSVGTHTIKVYDQVANHYPNMADKYKSKMSYFVLPE